MKHLKLIALLFVLFFNQTAIAQRANIRGCAGDAVHLKLLKENKKYKESFDRSAAEWQRYAAKHGNNLKLRDNVNSTAASPPPVTLNVVFHDMIAPSSTGMSNSDYLSILTIINNAFDGTSPISNDTGIQFCLAQHDVLLRSYVDNETWHEASIPALDPTDLEAVSQVVYLSGSQENVLGSSPTTSPFPSSKFINIYIVDNIAGVFDGFAFMPDAMGEKHDGIFIQRSALTTTGSNLALIHELGHYLGLFHIFGICAPTILPTLDVEVPGSPPSTTNPCSCFNDSCFFDGDMVCDTPPSMLLQTADYTCTINTCNTDTNSVGFGSPITNVNDFKDNYMDYGDPICIDTFTAGQIARMNFMIDPVYGPRKSLLGPSACDNCEAVNGCTFTIVPSSTLTAPRNAISQISTNTIAPISFTINNSGCTIGSGLLNYEWTLEFLSNPSVPITLGGTATAATLNLPTSLTVGNYRLTLNMVLASNGDCPLKFNYNFSVYPPTGTCNLNLPDDNTDWTGWQRVSYTGGWSRTLSASSNPFTFPTTNRTELPVTSASSNFEILSPTGIDSNFSAATGLPSGISNIMRVGGVINSSTTLPAGDASYVTVQFNPTAENCKYRVYYIGMVINAATGIYDYWPINKHQNQDSWFGILSAYDFTSPVTGTPTAASMGNTENGFLKTDLLTNNGGQYGMNDMVYGEFNSNYANTSIVTVAGLNYRRMNQWKSIDLDFSEFVGLGTTITLTFFARSNDANNAMAHAYAYFGLECKGGGIPAHYELELENVNLPCQSNAGSNCHTFTINAPNYVTSPQVNGMTLSWLGESNLLGNATVELSNDGSSFGSPTPIGAFYSDGGYKICQYNDVPYLYYRIKVYTLHGVNTKVIRVTNGFYHNNAPCTGVGDPAVYGGSHSIPPQIICPDISMPTFTASNPCFSEPPGGYVFEWRRSLSTPVLGTGASYTLDALQVWGCNDSVTRYVKFTDPYCGGTTWLPSEPFSFYNLTGKVYNFSTSYDNICSNGTFNFNVIDFNYTGHDCIPSAILDTLTNEDNLITFQLKTPDGIPIGEPEILDNPPIGIYSFTLSFDNLLNNIPIYPIGSSQHLVLSVDYNLRGCERHLEYDYYFNILESAVAGQIEYHCNTDTVVSLDDGHTPGSIYLWEVANDAGGPYNTIPGEYGATLVNASSFGTGTYPRFIKRMSYAFPGSDCEDSSYTLPVIINPDPTEPVMPTFGLICKGSDGPELETTNLVPGVWTNSALATVTHVSTASAGTSLYTFTPTSTCTSLSSYSLWVNVTDNIIPIFDPMPTVCKGSNSPLPSTSNNAITGSWAPAFDPQHSATYTFTPDVTTTACHGTTTAAITVLPALEFSVFTNYCEDDIAEQLPTSDLNGATGQWIFEGTVATEIDTSVAGTYIYEFVPTNPSLYCSNFSLEVNIHAHEVTPEFDLPDSICYGSTPPLLPTKDLNGIVGTWNPTETNYNITLPYTFTPLPGQCAATIVHTIEILPAPCSPTISWDSDVSCEIEDNDDVRDPDADIVDGPCIRVCGNSNVTYTIHLPVGIIDHIDWNITGGNISGHPTPDSCTILWNTGAFGAIQGVVHLTNGSSYVIDKCIEKLAVPQALFGIMPNNTLTNYDLCINSATVFDNLSSTNGGHDTLYYNWDFGDGHFSNEFEPVHTYTAAGVFIVKLTVFNGCNCQAEYTVTVRVAEGNVPISCPGVACEGEVSTYSIPFATADNCTIVWNIEGGQVVGSNSNNTSVQVLWDNVNSDGFGFVSIDSNACFSCPTVIKVPVVKTNGTIKGRLELCENEQGIYSLPKWPTTAYNWTIDDGGTGAYLVYNNQRNEIIVNSGTSGIVQLVCNYNNTLLGCGGTARYDIEVRPSVVLDGNVEACTGMTYTYQLNDSSDNNLPDISWTITGPDNFEESGTVSPFDFVFPVAGIYSIKIDSPNYCSSLSNIKVKEGPAAPTGIIGPILICPGIPNTYTCQQIAGYVASWSVTGGVVLGSSYGSSATVQFDPSASTYAVNVRYEGELCSSSNFSLTVNTIEPDLTLLEGETTICGSNVGHYRIADIQADSYTWTILSPETAGSVQSGQNSNAVDVLWNEYNGTATLQLEITKCGKSYIEQYPIHVVTTPTITINGDSPICTNESVGFSFSLLPAGIFNHVVWDFGDGDSQTVEFDEPLVSNDPYSITHVYDQPLTASTTYTVTATVHGASGCLAPATSTFTVTVSPSPVVTITPNSWIRFDGSTPPENNTLSINIQSGFCLSHTIKWFKNGVEIIGANDATYEVTDSPCAGSGTDYYYASVENSCGCTEYTMSIRAICEEPAPIGCNFNAQITGTGVNTGCQQLTFTRTNISIPPTEVDWEMLPPGTVDFANDDQILIKNMEPGRYSIDYVALYEVNGLQCSVRERFTGVVPYKAGIKFNAHCNDTNGTYTVNVLDHSVIFPDQDLDDLEFKFCTDGSTWQTGTVSSGIPQLNVELPPGSYNLGVMVSLPGHAPCTAFQSLVLPEFPIATFTASENNCQFSAVSFVPDDTSAGLQYEWNFGDGAINLQKFPVRVYAGSGLFLVTLTVKNQYGCSATSSKFIEVINVNMNGNLELLPLTNCVGRSVTIHYNASDDTPETITWYHNTAGSTPYAVTNSTSGLDLTTDQPGLYIAYLTDANGCHLYTTPPISVGFIPTPEPPFIKAPSTVCAGTPFTVSLPNNPSVTYTWSMNGAEFGEIGDSLDLTLNTPGTYVFDITAFVTVGTGGACTSLPASKTVTVIDMPDVPQIDFTVVSCDPYEVLVEVVNIQAGIDYYWSNGTTGSSTTMTHDGPLQVRAEAGGCYATAQVDLPLDLQALAWVFPTGCFANCDRDPLGYVIGPYGYYGSWSWMEDGISVDSGSGNIGLLTTAAPENHYELVLNNQYCDLTIGTLQLDTLRCEPCEATFDITSVSCVEVNGAWVYEMTIESNNPYSTTQWITLTAPGGHGYFVSNSIPAPSGYFSQTVYFFPLNNFGLTGGKIPITFAFDLEDKRCIHTIEYEFSPCIGPPRAVQLSLNEVGNDVLVVAPNPSQTTTTVYYLYAAIDDTDTKEVEIIDSLNRKILTLPIYQAKGEAMINTESFADGQYTVLLKANGKVVKKTKLLVHH